MKNLKSKCKLHNKWLIRFIMKGFAYFILISYLIIVSGTNLRAKGKNETEVGMLYYFYTVNRNGR